MCLYLMGTVPPCPLSHFGTDHVPIVPNLHKHQWLPPTPKQFSIDFCHLIHLKLYLPINDTSQDDMQFLFCGYCWYKTIEWLLFQTQNRFCNTSSSFFSSSSGLVEKMYRKHPSFWKYGHPTERSSVNDRKYSEKSTYDKWHPVFQCYIIEVWI